MSPILQTESSAQRAVATFEAPAESSASGLSRPRADELTNREPNGAEMIEDTAVRRRLLAIALRLERDGYSCEDLMQEALLHLWLESARRPGQTLSWYVQSCRFHLQHLIASGRSIDSAKRRCGHAGPLDTAEEMEDSIESLSAGDDVVSEVSAHEMFALLANRLQLKQRLVLEWLVDGFGPSDIGRKLNVSHAAIVNFRKKLASMLAGIGFVPQS
jgi:DNA-directed RNA polymerase specialized sigma24 family protein